MPEERRASVSWIYEDERGIFTLYVGYVIGRFVVMERSIAKWDYFELVQWFFCEWW